MLMNTTASTGLQAPRVSLSMQLARIIVVLYLAAIVFSQSLHSQFLVVIPIVFVSAVFTLFILEKYSYDLRSSGIILQIFCQFYFFGRIDFIEKNWGWYYVIAHAAYLLFLLGFYFGTKYFKSSKTIVERTQSSDVRLSEKKVVYRLHAVSISTFILYSASLQYLLVVTGASGTFLELIFQSLATRLTIAESGLSSILQFMYVLSAFGLGCTYILWRHYKHWTSLIGWILLIGCSALVLGSRGAIVIPIIQILLATSLLIRRPLAMLLAILLPLIIAVNIFSVWYLAAREGLETLSDENYSILNRFDAYENWLRISADRGLAFSPGASIPAVFLQFIPRKLYADKPYYFSTEMTKTYIPDAFDRGVNLDFGGIAESVYNFGPFGPPLFGFFLAWTVLVLDKLKQRAQQGKNAIYAYVYSQGALIPASFFFIGWINTAMIFGVIGFILTLKIFQKISRK
jgi:hypothetical protein